MKNMNIDFEVSKIMKEQVSVDDNQKKIKKALKRIRAIISKFTQSEEINREFCDFHRFLEISQQNFNNLEETIVK